MRIVLASILGCAALLGLGALAVVLLRDGDHFFGGLLLLITTVTLYGAIVAIGNALHEPRDRDL